MIKNFLQTRTKVMMKRSILILIFSLFLGGCSISVEKINVGSESVVPKSFLDPCLTLACIRTESFYYFEYKDKRFDLGSREYAEGDVIQSTDGLMRLRFTKIVNVPAQGDKTAGRAYEFEEVPNSSASTTNNPALPPSNPALDPSHMGAGPNSGNSLPPVSNH